MRINRIKLYTAIKARDMKQGTVADKAGVSRATLSGILAGRSCLMETGIKIADALGMKLEELM